MWPSKPKTEPDEETRERIANIRQQTLNLLTERRRLEEDILKVSTEHQKLAWEVQRAPTNLRLEKLKALAGFGTFFVGLGAVFTLLFSFYTFGVDSERKVADRIASLFRDFGAKEPAIRVSAATGLAPYVTNASFGPQVAANLALLLTLDEEPQVQRALVEVLKASPGQALLHLRAVSVRISGEVLPLFNDLERAKRDRQTSALERLEQRIKARQNALVLAALTIRELGCKEPSLQVACTVDLATRPLKGFQFALRHSRELRGANFRGTTLWSADLFDVDLEAADFTGAWLNSADLRNAKLGQANFTDAHLERIQRMQPGAPRTRFEGADLKGAIFARACLGGADFTGALNLVPEQFAAAFVEGAVFDHSLAQQLQSYGLAKGDPRCQSY